MVAKQCGPQQKRVTLDDGTTVILPEGAVMSPPAPKNMTDEQATEWLAEEMKKPAGGTW